MQNEASVSTWFFELPLIWAHQSVCVLLSLFSSQGGWEEDRYGVTYYVCDLELSWRLVRCEFQHRGVVDSSGLGWRDVGFDSVFKLDMSAL